MVQGESDSDSGSNDSDSVAANSEGNAIRDTDSSSEASFGNPIEHPEQELGGQDGPVERVEEEKRDIGAPSL